MRGLRMTCSSRVGPHLSTTENSNSDSGALDAVAGTAVSIIF